MHDHILYFFFFFFNRYGIKGTYGVKEASYFGLLKTM